MSEICGTEIKDAGGNAEKFIQLIKAGHFRDCKTEFRIEQRHCDESELFAIDDYNKLRDSFYGPPAQER